MPPVKPRDMEDTWNPAELEKSLKGGKDDKKRHRDKDRDRDKDRERRKERPKDDEDRKHRRKKDEDGDRKDREKRDRDKDKDREKKDRDKDRERRHRDRENGEGEERKHRKKDGEEKDDERRRRKHREEGQEKDDDRERRRRKHREEGEKGDKERRRKHHDDEDEDRRRRRRHHDEDDEERRKRREERKKQGDKDGEGKERRRHRDDDDKERRHKDRDEDKEQRRRRHDREDENGERRRHRDDRDADREKRREERDRRHHDEDEKSRRHKEKEKEKEKEKREKEEQKQTKIKRTTSTGKAKAARKVSAKKEVPSFHSYQKLRKSDQTLKLKSHDSSKSSQKIGKSGSPIKINSKNGLKLPAKRPSMQGKDKVQKQGSRQSIGKGYLKSESSLSRHDTSRRGTSSGSGSPVPSTSTAQSNAEIAPRQIPHISSSASDQKSSEDQTEEDEYNYDDDFEDYEEDFEEDDDDEDQENENEISEKDRVKHEGKESPPPTTPRSVRDLSSAYIRSKNWEGTHESRREMDDILQAMDAENNRLLSESQNKYRDESPTRERSSKRPTTGKPRAYINFVSAKQRQMSSKASQRAKMRGKELLAMIELDRAAYDLFDMPPVSEYELYMRTFGRSDTKQRYIQTNEDNLDKDLQTEEIETLEKWVQCPPEDTKGCGGDKAAEEEEESKPVDTVALTKFVQSAGQAMLILLEEDRAEASHGDSNQKRSNICLSEAFLEISAPPFFRDRCVSCTQFSEAQTHMLLTVHDKPTGVPVDRLTSKGAVCVWNVNEPSYPQKVLVCEGQPQCCCFSPVKANLVFAGMADGSVAVWDLREPNSLHKQHIEGDESWFLRYPTYNTAGVLHYENHQSAVSSIVPVYVPGSMSDMDTSGVEGTTSFQLATVEENATLHLWVVAEIAHPDPAGSESDLGLAPGGRVKLIKSSVIVLENPMRDARLRTTMKAFEMKLLPSDPSHFYVGTDTGHIIHGVRHGGKAPPKAYKPDIDAPLEVTSLDFSPFTEPVFLTGCADGSIRLYHVNNAAPMIVWESTTGGRPVLAVRWCQSRPSVFFVVDTSSRLYIWDLLMSDAIPMKDEVISQYRLTSFCLSNDYAATGMGMAGRKPAMAVSYDTGRVEVHTVSQQFSALMPEEVDQFAQFLGQSN